MRVAWDASHGEFTITDYYYFSKLSKVAEKEGIVIEEVNSFWKLGEYDIIVFNYPEIFFRKREVARIKTWVKKGKKIILAAYYSNFDRVAENVNRVAEKFNLRVNYDLIRDPDRNAGDDMFPIANCGDLEVVMPCSASVSGGEPFVVGKDVFAAKTDGVLVLGTCVFWDNYALEFADNKEFAVRILSGEF